MRATLSKDRTLFGHLKRSVLKDKSLKSVLQKTNYFYHTKSEKILEVTGYTIKTTSSNFYVTFESDGLKEEIQLRRDYRKSDHINFSYYDKLPLIYELEEDFIDDLIQKNAKDLELLEKYKSAYENKANKMKGVMNIIADAKTKYPEHFL